MSRQQVVQNAQLPTAVQDVLASFLGPDGDYFATIRDYPHINSGIKILYLERAFTEDHCSFYRFLDKLYIPKTNPDEESRQLELLRSYKFIHDICFNTKLKFQYSAYAGVQEKRAIEHYFRGCFGANALMPEDRVFKDCITEMVMERATEMDVSTPSSILDKQINDRKALEKSIIRETAWREKLELLDEYIVALTEYDRLVEALDLTDDKKNHLTEAGLNPDSLIVLKNLYYFITQLHLTLIDAVDEIHSLNEEKLTLLIKFYHLGLRGNHLRRINSQLTNDHIKAIEYFSQTHHLSMESIIEKIAPLSAAEVLRLRIRCGQYQSNYPQSINFLFIQAGYSYWQVIDKIETLDPVQRYDCEKIFQNLNHEKKLFISKVVLESLIEQSQLSFLVKKVGDLDDTLFNFLFNQKFSNEMPLLVDFLKNCSKEKIKCIRKFSNQLSLELILSEIKDLSDEQIDALDTLYVYGLRGEHLRKFENGFSIAHKEALEYFIKQQGSSFDIAIQSISSLSATEAKLFCEKYQFYKTHAPAIVDYLVVSKKLPLYYVVVDFLGRFTQENIKFINGLRDHLSPELIWREIDGLSIEEIDTLENLYSYGLRGDHLRKFKSQFTESHQKIFLYFVKDRHIKADDVIQCFSQVNFDKKIISDFYWCSKNNPESLEYFIFSKKFSLVDVVTRLTELSPVARYNLENCIKENKDVISFFDLEDLKHFEKIGSRTKRFALSQFIGGKKYPIVYMLEIISKLESFLYDFDKYERFANQYQRLSTRKKELMIQMIMLNEIYSRDALFNLIEKLFSLPEVMIDFFDKKIIALLKKYSIDKIAGFYQLILAEEQKRQHVTDQFPLSFVELQEKMHREQALNEFARAHDKILKSHKEETEILNSETTQRHHIQQEVFAFQTKAILSEEGFNCEHIQRNQSAEFLVIESAGIEVAEKSQREKNEAEYVVFCDAVMQSQKNVEQVIADEGKGRLFSSDSEIFEFSYLQSREQQEKLLRVELSNCTQAIKNESGPVIAKNYISIVQGALEKYKNRFTDKKSKYNSKASLFTVKSSGSKDLQVAIENILLNSSVADTEKADAIKTILEKDGHTAGAAFKGVLNDFRLLSKPDTLKFVYEKYAGFFDKKVSAFFANNDYDSAIAQMKTVSDTKSAAYKAIHELRL